MLLTVADFKQRVAGDMDVLVGELQGLTGRSTPEEEEAWRRSLPAVAQAFSAPSFDLLELYFGSRGSIGIEYQLPASSSWCDLVLLGEHQNRPSAVICELKDWQTVGFVAHTRRQPYSFAPSLLGLQRLMKQT